MSQRTIRVGASLVCLLGIQGCSGSDEAGLAEEERGAASEPFSTSPGEPNHEEITAAGLPFLRPEVLVAVQAANVATDAEFFFVNANHFDDCNFTGGSTVVRDSQAEAVLRLDPSAPSPEADLLAIRAFGRSLHAVQDFYAHTNWIELGGDALVDASLAAFPVFNPYATIPGAGFVVVQGRKPQRAALSRDDDAPYPSNAVVSVKLEKTWALGLISGTVDYEAGDLCPASVAMTHEELNKDKSTNVGRSEQYEAAKALAIAQTQHEWCRLRELVRASWGAAGVLRLDTWLAADATLPTCE